MGFMEKLVAAVAEAKEELAKKAAEVPESATFEHYLGREGYVRLVKVLNEANLNKLSIASTIGQEVVETLTPVMPALLEKAEEMTKCFTTIDKEVQAELLTAGRQAGITAVSEMDPLHRAALFGYFDELKARTGLI